MTPPHASRFAAGETADAKRAAGLMGMHLLEISDDTHQSLAAGLPQGRLIESGNAFVPFVKAEVFDRLGHLEIPSFVGSGGVIL